MVTLVPCRCCLDALTVHKHNRGNLAKPLQKLKHLDHFSGSCDGNQHTGVDQPLPCLGLAGLDSGGEGLQGAQRGRDRGCGGGAGSPHLSSPTWSPSSASQCSNLPLVTCGNTDLNFSAFLRIISLTLLLQRTLIHYI